MLPVCRTGGEGFAIPTFDLVPSDVEGFMEELWEFQSASHDCFARSEPRAHFFDYMVGQLSQLERKSVEPMALHVDGGTIRGTLNLSQFVARKHWLRRCASLAVSAPISCKEASCFEADAVPCTLTSTSYKL